MWTTPISMWRLWVMKISIRNGGTVWWCWSIRRNRQNLTRKMCRTRKKGIRICGAFMFTHGSTRRWQWREIFTVQPLLTRLDVLNTRRWKQALQMVVAGTCVATLQAMRRWVRMLQGLHPKSWKEQIWLLLSAWHTRRIITWIMMQWRNWDWSTRTTMIASPLLVLLLRRFLHYILIPHGFSSYWSSSLL